MGFRFRKSIGKGAFRLNFSKSGIGYSAGVKGLRFTKMANGRNRSTISVPGTGLSYVSESSNATSEAEQTVEQREDVKVRRFNKKGKNRHPILYCFFACFIFVTIVSACSSNQEIESISATGNVTMDINEETAHPFTTTPENVNTSTIKVQVDDGVEAKIKKHEVQIKSSGTEGKFTIELTSDKANCTISVTVVDKTKI